MNARIGETQRQTVINCGRMCERALDLARLNARTGREIRARYWQRNAEFWSARAFLEVRT